MAPVQQLQGAPVAGRHGGDQLVVGGRAGGDPVGGHAGRVQSRAVPRPIMAVALASDGGAGPGRPGGGGGGEPGARCGASSSSAATTSTRLSPTIQARLDCQRGSPGTLPSWTGNQAGQARPALDSPTTAAIAAAPPPRTEVRLAARNPAAVASRKPGSVPRGQVGGGPAGGAVQQHRQGQDRHRSER